MPIPGNIKDREHRKFIESPTRGDENTAVEVFVGNQVSDAIPVEVTNNSDNLITDIADENISAIRAIYKTPTGVSLANNNIDYDQATVIGITRTAALAGNNISYQEFGKMFDSSFNFAASEQIYLDVNGQLTSTAPIAGFRTLIGYGLGAGAIQININEPIMI